MAARGECRMPLARAAKRLKRLKTAMGSYWKKLAWIWVWRHVRLGLAPRPFGVGAAPAWESTVNATRAIEIDRIPRLGQASLVFIARRLRFRRNSSPDKSIGLLLSAQACACRGGLTRRQSRGREHASAVPTRNENRLIRRGRTASNRA